MLIMKYNILQTMIILLCTVISKVVPGAPSATSLDPSSRTSAATWSPSEGSC
ncbi:hypothetical protein NHX12_030847, partial [Muraenolepis orangiensis]